MTTPARFQLEPQELELINSPAKYYDSMEEGAMLYSPSRPPDARAEGSSGVAGVSRLLDRDGDFHQSLGRLAIRKKIRRRDWRALYAYDLFHSLVDAPTHRLIVILFVLYVSLVIFFSVVYLGVSLSWPMCNMGLATLTDAFYFSLETTATIGFGTRDVFFGDCIVPGVVLTFHMCIRLVSDSLTVGVLYSRLARPTTRASTVLFCKDAIIRRIQGSLYFMFQVVELRKHQLNEAHVRLYCVRKDPDTSSSRLHPGSSSPSACHFQTCSMRLKHPDDETGSMLLLCLPQVVIHRVDASSPLMPPPQWVRAECEGKEHEYTSSSERWSEDERFETPAQAHERLVIQKYMLDRSIEVIAVVEGVDAATGGVVQARHSYTSAEIKWNCALVPCVLTDPEGFAMIDFSLFHHLEPASIDSAQADLTAI